MSSTEFLPSNLARVFVLPLFLLPGCAAPAMIEGEYESIVWSVDWAGPQHAIIIGGNQHEITTFSGGNLEPQLTIPVAGTITNLKWDPKGEYLAAAAQSGEVPFVYDLTSGRRTVLDSVSSSGARGLGWSPDGTYLAVGDNDGYLLLFKRDGVLYRRRKIDPKAITGLDWHPAGNHLVTVGSGIGTYDIAADTAGFRMSRELPTLMLSIAWHPDGNSFATGDYGEPDNGIPPVLQFWSANNTLLWQDTTSRAEYRNLSWDPNGKVLASASDGVRLWSVDGKKLRHGLRDRYVWGIAWSPGGSQLVATTGNGETIVLDRRLKTTAFWQAD